MLKADPWSMKKHSTFWECFFNRLGPVGHQWLRNLSEQQKRQPDLSELPGSVRFLELQLDAEFFSDRLRPLFNALDTVCGDSLIVE